MHVLTKRTSIVVLLFQSSFISTLVENSLSQIPRKCGLPEDISVLPDFAQDEIRAAWKDYVPGTPCDKEQTITEDILAVLEMFNKEFEEEKLSASQPEDQQQSNGKKQKSKTIPLSITQSSKQDQDADLIDQPHASAVNINLDYSDIVTASNSESKNSLPVSSSLTTASTSSHFSTNSNRRHSNTGGLLSPSASQPVGSTAYIHTVTNPKAASWRVKPARPQQQQQITNQPLTLLTHQGRGGPLSVAPKSPVDVDEERWIVTTSPIDVTGRKETDKKPQNDNERSKDQAMDSRQGEFLLTTKINPSTKKSTLSSIGAPSTFSTATFGQSSKPLTASTGGGPPSPPATNFDGSSTPANGVDEPVVYDYESGAAAGTINKLLPKDEEDAKKFLFEEDDQLPFLQGADEDLVRLFQEVLHDPDIPSESRRMEEIHLLAVSYLTARQLQAFNSWSTKRRKRVQLFERQQFDSVKRSRNLPGAATALGALTHGGNGVVGLPASPHLTPEAREEIRNFVHARLEKYKNDFR